MNKALKAKQLIQTAAELRVIQAALDWHSELLDDNATERVADSARYKRIANKLHELEAACHDLKRADAGSHP